MVNQTTQDAAVANTVAYNDSGPVSVYRNLITNRQVDRSPVTTVRGSSRGTENYKRKDSRTVIDPLASIPYYTCTQNRDSSSRVVHVSKHLSSQQTSAVVSPVSSPRSTGRGRKDTNIRYAKSASSGNSVSCVGTAAGTASSISGSSPVTCVDEVTASYDRFSSTGVVGESSGYNLAHRLLASGSAEHHPAPVSVLKRNNSFTLSTASSGSRQTGLDRYSENESGGSGCSSNTARSVILGCGSITGAASGTSSVSSSSSSSAFIARTRGDCTVGTAVLVDEELGNTSLHKYRQSRRVKSTDARTAADASAANHYYDTNAGVGLTADGRVVLREAAFSQLPATYSVEEPQTLSSSSSIGSAPPHYYSSPATNTATGSRCPHGLTDSRLLNHRVRTPTAHGLNLSAPSSTRIDKLTHNYSSCTPNIFSSTHQLKKSKHIPKRFGTSPVTMPVMTASSRASSLCGPTVTPTVTDTIAGTQTYTGSRSKCVDGEGLIHRLKLVTDELRCTGTDGADGTPGAGAETSDRDVSREDSRQRCLKVLVASWNTEYLPLSTADFIRLDWLFEPTSELFSTKHRKPEHAATSWRDPSSALSSCTDSVGGFNSVSPTESTAVSQHRWRRRRFGSAKHVIQGSTVDYDESSTRSAAAVHNGNTPHLFCPESARTRLNASPANEPRRAGICGNDIGSHVSTRQYTTDNRQLSARIHRPPLRSSLPSLRSLSNGVGLFHPSIGTAEGCDSGGGGEVVRRRNYTAADTGGGGATMMKANKSSNNLRQHVSSRRCSGGGATMVRANKSSNNLKQHASNRRCSGDAVAEEEEGISLLTSSSDAPPLPATRAGRNTPSSSGGGVTRESSIGRRIMRYVASPRMLSEWRDKRKDVKNKGKNDVHENPLVCDSSDPDITPSPAASTTSTRPMGSATAPATSSSTRSVAWSMPHEAAHEVCAPECDSRRVVGVQRRKSLVQSISPTATALFDKTSATVIRSLPRRPSRRTSATTVGSAATIVTSTSTATSTAASTPTATAASTPTATVAST
eukprot:Lankesteria_metandrocarpae@DN929_c0_g1_i1.p1